MDTEHADPGELAFLRAAFGATGPDRRCPPLGWAGVRAFEARHGVVLPEPYRTCVAEIADGSPAGPPQYGLVPLDETPSGWGGGRRDRVLSEPFPLTDPWFWDAEEPRPSAALDARIEEVFHHGTVVLGTDGCGMCWHLVVTGPHRGHVWLITGEGAGPFGARFGFTTAEAGFAGWVRHWSAGGTWFDTD